MTRGFLAALCVAILPPAIASAAERRQLGAHEHGHGTVAIAVEDKTVAIELEAPGADIAGFEYEPKTPKDKETVEGAMAQLKQPLALLTIPAAAQCTAREIDVEIEGEPEGQQAQAAHAPTDQVHADHAHTDHKHEGEAKHAGGHTAYHARYTLVCAAPAALTSLTFAYFKSFANARRLTVDVITPKGQSKFEATPERPTIDLSGLM